MSKKTKIVKTQYLQSVRMCAPLKKITQHQYDTIFNDLLMFPATELQFQIVMIQNSPQTPVTSAKRGRHRGAQENGQFSIYSPLCYTLMMPQMLMFCFVHGVCKVKISAWSKKSIKNH